MTELIDQEIDAVFHCYASANDNGVAYLRTYESGFRCIARAIIQADRAQCQAGQGNAVTVPCAALKAMQDEIAQLQDLASRRLEQMQADRQQAMLARDAAMRTSAALALESAAEIAALRKIIASTATGNDVRFGTQEQRMELLKASVGQAAQPS